MPFLSIHFYSAQACRPLSLWEKSRSIGKLRNLWLSCFVVSQWWEWCAVLLKSSMFGTESASFIGWWQWNRSFVIGSFLRVGEECLCCKMSMLREYQKCASSEAAISKPARQQCVCEVIPSGLKLYHQAFLLSRVPGSSNIWNCVDLLCPVSQFGYSSMN